ncbi:oxidoreductase [Candidatus Nanohalovita haloferacivicina]|uniref:oxidoreductase n=1 Tax=Candidatus Nanohalovita haloferacivicina TaxID=2978046 RepID=UPI00325FD45D|nr:Short-chain dehydrogenase/reductase SDR [Candidatus Nanohalobia archaeon BNXNv]
MSNWTAKNLPDMEGKTALVTGANSGIGFEATKKLVEHNAKVIMACRIREKGLDAQEEIEKEVENADLEVKQVDLASLNSVKEFAEEVNSEYEKIDMLFNNAGIMAIPRRETEDSLEYQIGVNHFGHFALTGQILEKLEASDGEARIVTQSSIAHTSGDIDLEDINHEEEYDRWQAYSDSKLANVLFGKELDRKLDENNTDITSVVSHPGVSKTNLFNADESQHNVIVSKLMSLGLKVFGHSPKSACLPMLYAATSEEIEGGEYVGPGGFRSIRGYPEVQNPSEKALDEELAEDLWNLSEELTGVEYDL